MFGPGAASVFWFKIGCTIYLNLVWNFLPLQQPPSFEIFTRPALVLRHSSDQSNKGPSKTIQNQKQHSWQWSETWLYHIVILLQPFEIWNSPWPHYCIFSSNFFAHQHFPGYHSTTVCISEGQFWNTTGRLSWFCVLCICESTLPGEWNKGVRWGGVPHQETNIKLDCVILYHYSTAT